MIPAHVACATSWLRPALLATVACVSSTAALALPMATATTRTPAPVADDRVDHRPGAPLAPAGAHHWLSLGGEWHLAHDVGWRAARAPHVLLELDLAWLEGPWNLDVRPRWWVTGAPVPR